MQELNGFPKDAKLGSSSRRWRDQCCTEAALKYVPGLEWRFRALRARSPQYDCFFANVESSQHLLQERTFYSATASPTSRHVGKSTVTSGPGTAWDVLRCSPYPLCLVSGRFCDIAHAAHHVRCTPRIWRFLVLDRLHVGWPTCFSRAGRRSTAPRACYDFQEIQPPAHAGMGWRRGGSGRARASCMCSGKGIDVGIAGDGGVDYMISTSFD